MTTVIIIQAVCDEAIALLNRGNTDDARKHQSYARLYDHPTAWPWRGPLTIVAVAPELAGINALDARKAGHA